MSPIAEGTALAVLAALLFGVTTPVVHWAGADAGSFTVATLLYLGAALGSFSWRTGSTREARIRRADAPRLGAVALAGAVVAPVCFAWGLRHTSATSASLLLNLEAAFTALIGWWLYGEHVGGRAGLALGLMLAGGMLLATHQGSGAGGGASGGMGMGALAVVAATLAWAVDNTLSRPLADLDSAAVVRWKAALGAALSALLALAFREAPPAPSHVLALAACGATGYGLSLRSYLLAQRRVGALRTASIFSLAPFIGAAVAWLAGEGAPGGAQWVAAAVFAVAVGLHATERHAHRHSHEPLEHEHAHRHDDGHHDHAHPADTGASVAGVHSHVHVHEPLTHEHPHGPDAHHRHRH